MTQYVPGDLQVMLNKYNSEGCGPCGPACIAVIEKKSIRAVLDDWRTYFGEYRGWAAWRELNWFLKKKGRTVLLKRLKESKVPLTPEKLLICRVQWLGPNPDKPQYACWNHWTEAASHTHFILVDNEEIFCSEEGWFPFKDLDNYLTEKIGKASGVITSYMEVSR